MREVVQSKIEYYTCDYCNGELEYITIEVNFGYGSHRDGKQTHFCSDECLSKYLLKTKKSCVNDATCEKESKK